MAGRRVHTGKKALKMCPVQKEIFLGIILSIGFITVQQQCQYRLFQGAFREKSEKTHLLL